MTGCIATGGMTGGPSGIATRGMECPPLGDISVSFGFDSWLGKVFISHQSKVAIMASQVFFVPIPTDFKTVVTPSDYDITCNSGGDVVFDVVSFDVQIQPNVHDVKVECC